MDGSVKEIVRLCSFRAMKEDVVLEDERRGTDMTTLICLLYPLGLPERTLARLLARDCSVNPQLLLRACLTS